MKPGTKYRQFIDKEGVTVILRAMRWEDLDDLLEIINGLIDERDENPNLGIIMDQKQTRDSEAQFISSTLQGIENGSVINVLAEVQGKAIANSEVMRGKSSDVYHHGKLGIAISKIFRNKGIGREMIKTLIEENRKAGRSTPELEVFADNSNAIYLYESLGFIKVGTIRKKVLRKDVFHDIIVMSMVL